MIDLFPGLPLMTRALIVAGFILLIIVVAGVALLIGRSRARGAQSFDIDKRGPRAAGAVVPGVLPPQPKVAAPATAQPAPAAPAVLLAASPEAFASAPEVSVESAAAQPTETDVNSAPAAGSPFAAPAADPSEW
jgi:hypothetical protein